jgi:hypothetical protein
MIDAGIGANSASDSRYGIDNSYKNESNNSERMYRPWGASGGNSQTFTVSVWVKRTEINTQQYIWGAGTDGNNFFLVSFESNNTLRVRSYVSGSDQSVYITNRFFRDTAAWYHIVTAVDTTSGTAGDRLRIYINGVEETSFSTETNFSQNDSTMHNANSSYMEIGTVIGEANRFCGYISEVISISGSQLAPTTFGKFDTATGIWIPKEYTGSFPQNSVYLEFKDSSSLGTDTSGNSQTFTLQNLSAADQATDTPTNNFATLNPLHYTTKYTITEGGTNQVSSVNGWGTSVGSIGVTSGKWYFEIKTPDNNGYTTFGAIDADSILSQYINGDAHAGDTPYGISYYGGNGGIIVNGSYISGTSFSSYNTQIMGCALDLDNNKIYFSKSGTYGNSGNPVTGANGISLPSGGSGTWFFSTSTYVQPLATNQGGYTTFSISSAESDENGYGTFEYAPPTGYYALCTKNLAEYG